MLAKLPRICAAKFPRKSLAVYRRVTNIAHARASRSYVSRMNHGLPVKGRRPGSRGTPLLSGLELRGRIIAYPTGKIREDG